MDLLSHDSCETRSPRAVLGGSHYWGPQRDVSARGLPGRLHSVGTDN